jgi:hypothetical protein
MNESPTKTNNSLPYDSYNSIEKYEALKDSAYLESSPEVDLKRSLKNENSDVEYNHYLVDSPDKNIKGSYYEQMKTTADQYNNELLKGQDKKNQDVPLPCQFCLDSNMEGSTTIITPKAQIHSNLNKKYLTSRDYYNSKVITDIIYNENTNLVSVFKDYLIYDDISEFLKRYYSTDEFPSRLPKIFEFYEKYSKVFPNYVNIPENKYMFKNIERKQKFIDDKQKAIEQMKMVKEKGDQKDANFSDLLEESTDHMFSTTFMDSILKQNVELEAAKVKRHANERLMQAIEAINTSDSMMDAVNTSNITGDISMSVMDNKELSDLSCIKSEITEDQPVEPSVHHDFKDLESSNAGTKKRKVNVFEYNNLVNINKKMRMTNLSKPLQRTDIIHLESSLDFEKDDSNHKNVNKVMMSQRISGKDILSKNSYAKYQTGENKPKPIIKKGTLKNLKISSSEQRFTNESTPLGGTKKVKVSKYYNTVKNGGRQSENDDRKTFISSTDKHGDSMSTRSRGYMPKVPFKVKRVNKKFPYNIMQDQKIILTPDKQSTKNPDNKIIITKRNDGQKILKAHKKVVLAQNSLYEKQKALKGRFISHERKVSALPVDNINPLPLYMTKTTANSTSTPLIVCNGINSYHRHHKSKDTLMANNRPRLESDIQSIYSKPIAIPSKTTSNVSLKKRKKGRGFPSQHQVQPPKMKKLMTTSNASFTRSKQTSRFSSDGLVVPIANSNNLGNHVLPIYQNINEEHFKNHILMEGVKKPQIKLKQQKTERAKVSLKSSRKGRGSMGSLISGLPNTTNNNHHYGGFFNTNTNVKKSKDGSVKDRKRMKNLKHIRKLCNDKPSDTFGRYFQPLTDRNNVRRLD